MASFPEVVEDLLRPGLMDERQERPTFAQSRDADLGPSARWAWS